MPFLKAEIGFVAGVAFKIRGMAYLGKSKYTPTIHYGINNIGAFDVLETSTEGSNGYSISAIIMPFSWTWNAD